MKGQGNSAVFQNIDYRQQVPLALGMLYSFTDRWALDIEGVGDLSFPPDNSNNPAELYTGAEEIIAEAIRGIRSKIFLVSKVLPSNASYKGTLRACDASLRRLKTDYLDAYLLHWWSGSHPIGETMRAMEELVTAGKVRYIGVSNFDVDRLKQAQRALTRDKIICDQVIYHLQGVPYLEPGTRIFPEDLEAWEKKTGVRAMAGDALLLRWGRWTRRAKLGVWPITESAAGLDNSVIPWLKKRDIAILGWETPDYAPHPPGDLPPSSVHNFH